MKDFLLLGIAFIGMIFAFWLGYDTGYWNRQSEELEKKKNGKS